MQILALLVRVQMAELAELIYFSCLGEQEEPRPCKMEGSATVKVEEVAEPQTQLPLSVEREETLL